MLNRHSLVMYIMRAASLLCFVPGEKKSFIAINVKRYIFRLYFALIWYLSICLVRGFVLLLSATKPTSWKVARACWGSDPQCNKYKLECPSGQTINLGSSMYGTKTELLACQYGVSNCAVASACCFYNASDKLTPFSYADMTIMSLNCFGKQFCEVNAPRLGVSPFSSYVLVNYTCSESK